MLTGRWLSTASGQNCLEYGPRVSLSGTLSSRVFAGPPNYESSKRGDRKDTAIILSLATATSRCCTTTKTPDSDAIDVPETDIRQVQLVITKPSHWKQLKRLLGKPVTVSGTLFHAHTGHHRTKVLIDVAELKTQ